MTIQIKSLTLARQNNKLFNRLSLTIPSGKWHMIGRNGTGKSSLLLAITHQLEISGIVSISGVDYKEGNAYKLEYGYCADKLHYFPFATANQFLSVNLKAFGLKDIPNEVMSLFMEFDLASQLSARISDLSLGNQKKLSLICALVSSGSWLLLDEPYNGLDAQSVIALSKYLELTKKNILMTNHNNISAKGFRTFNLDIL